MACKNSIILMLINNINMFLHSDCNFFPADFLTAMIFEIKNF